jgi:hypothetical protein
VLVQAGRLDVISHSASGLPMRVQIQLRIITDDENVLSDDVIACFENLFARHRHIKKLFSKRGQRLKPSEAVGG